MNTYELIKLFFMVREIYNEEIINLSVDIIGRIDEDEFDIDNAYEDVTNAVDEGLIYYEDMWTVLKFYCNPNEADWDYAETEYINLLVSIYNYIIENNEDEEDDDEE